MLTGDFKKSQFYMAMSLNNKSSTDWYSMTCSLWRAHTDNKERVKPFTHGHTLKFKAGYNIWHTKAVTSSPDAHWGSPKSLEYTISFTEAHSAALLSAITAASALLSLF